jgi:DNA-binding SARP family transcriptional activator
MAHDVALRILGPVGTRANGAWLTGRPQQRLVLAVLAVHADQVIRAGDLIGAVWDGTPPSSARGSLQALVTRVRELLAGLADAGVQRHGDGYRLQIEPDRVDVWRFRALIRAGRATADKLGALAAFEQALALWRGPALADVPSTAAIERLRSGLTEELISARQERIGVLLDVGREREAVEDAAGLLAGNPLDEGLAEMLMVALNRCGRRAEALQVFRTMRGQLAGVHGVEPGPELQRVRRRILAGDPLRLTPRRYAAALSGGLGLARQLDLDGCRGEDGVCLVPHVDRDRHAMTAAAMDRGVDDPPADERRVSGERRIAVLRLRV